MISVYLNLNKKFRYFFIVDFLVEMFFKIYHYQKICFGSRFRVTVMTYPVLTENDGKRILHPKRFFSNRFSETVMTSADLTGHG